MLYFQQLSTDGERNNERQASQSRRRLQNSSVNRTESAGDARLASDSNRGARERRLGRNNNMDYGANMDTGPDRNDVVARLMQIRDFKKQARAMMESMEKLGDRKKPEDVEKVRRLMRNLQEQEQGYRGLLQPSRVQRDNEEAGGDSGRDESLPYFVQVEEESDDSSVDLEVRSQNSETSDNSNDTRPRIESKLGLGSENDDDTYTEPLRGATGGENSNSNRTMEALDNFVDSAQYLPGVPVQEVGHDFVLF